MEVTIENIKWNEEKSMGSAELRITNAFTDPNRVIEKTVGVMSDLEAYKGTVGQGSFTDTCYMYNGMVYDDLDDFANGFIFGYLK